MTARSLIVACSVSALLAFGPNAGAGRATRALKISAAAAAKWVEVGKHIAISGSVTPHLAGVQVTLQERQAGAAWNAIGNATLNASGAFSFTTTPRKIGPTQFRVVTSNDTNFVGASGNVPVRVLHWLYLTNIDQYAYINPIVGDRSIDPVTLDGVTYKHPLTLDAGCYNFYNGGAWIDYVFEGQYKAFAATVSSAGF